MADCNNCSSYLSSEDIIRRSVKCSGGSLAFIGSNVNPLANEVEVDTYIAELTVPISDRIIGELNTTVRNLKARLGITELSECFDVLRFHAAETIESGLRNLAKDNHHASANPLHYTFQQYDGMTSESPTYGSLCHIDEEFAPTDGVNYTATSATFGIYTKLDETTAKERYFVGTINTNTPYQGSLLCLDLRITGYNVIRGAINSDHVGINTNGIANPIKEGSYIVTRNGNNCTIYKDGIFMYSYNIDASELNNNNFYTLARNMSGISSNEIKGQISAFFALKGVNANEALIVHQEIKRYLDAIDPDLQPIAGLDNAILSEDGKSFFISENGSNYLQQEN